MSNQDFQEIGHSGGKVTFAIRGTSEGHVSYQVQWSHARPVPTAVFAVYAIPQGVPVGDIDIKGMGVPWNPPPILDCFPVFIASDGESMFGRQCDRCGGYWRVKHLAKVCPYCGTEAAQSYHFLTGAQLRYVKQYCDFLNDALGGDQDGDYTIDMDAVADAVGNEGEPPPFYQSEERQQNLFQCDACGAVNDVLGTYAYCSQCATRNDLQELRKVLSRVRDSLTAGGSNEAAVKEAVAAFDSFSSQVAGQMLRTVPMTPARRDRVEKTRFHNLETTIAMFGEVFGIEIMKGLSSDDAGFVTLRFHRRHVYEHKGGEADEKYIADSGDAVRLKQALRETKDSAHRTIGLVGRIAGSLHEGFHSIFPPREEPIERFKQQKRGDAAPVPSR